ncbi:MAG: D-aminoacyl-tRNA deacylase [Bacteroidia bacterium]
MNLSVLEISMVKYLSFRSLHMVMLQSSRPSFIHAARPEQATFHSTNILLKVKLSSSIPVITGVFGADMKISLTNDGPVTIIMDSKK